MAGDWIKLHRKMLKSAISEDMTLLGCWTWILLNANWEERELLNGETLKPGELITSMERLGDAWGCGKSSAHRRLKKFKKRDMISFKGGKIGTHIKVLNWSVYQDIGDPTREDSGKIAGRWREDSGKIAGREEEVKKERREEGKKKEIKEISQKPGCLGEVISHWRDKGLSGQAEAFWDFYESKGWLVGKTPMKRWRAAASGWSRRARAESQNGQPRKTAQDLRAEKNDQVLRDFLERHKHDGDEANGGEGVEIADGELARETEQRRICGDLFAGDG